VNLRHTIWHHAIWDEVFPNVFRGEMAGLQSCYQRLGIVSQHIGPLRGKEMDGLTGDCDDVGEDLLQSVVNAPQKFGTLWADVLLRRTQLQ